MTFSKSFATAKETEMHPIHFVSPEASVQVIRYGLSKGLHHASYKIIWDCCPNNAQTNKMWAWYIYLNAALHKLPRKISFLFRWTLLWISSFSLLYMQPLTWFRTYILWKSQECDAQTIHRYCRLHISWSLKNSWIFTYHFKNVYFSISITILKWLVLWYLQITIHNHLSMDDRLNNACASWYLSIVAPTPHLLFIFT